MRAAFALRQGSLPLLVSKQITDRSRIIVHRDVIERLATVAPFIRWEQQPTALVVGGRIVFLAAGYTVSDSYPYAHRTHVAGGSADYARAAVQATVDAYSGRIRLYAADRTDPILRAWDAAFPGMFEPVSGMPPGLRERLRYPSALSDAQAQLYQRFRVTARRPSQAAPTRGHPRPGCRSDRGCRGYSLRRRRRGRAAAADEALLPVRDARGRGRISPVAGDALRPARCSESRRDARWTDQPAGRARARSRSLPRDRVTPGPAQVSHLVNLTPRIANSLGIRNREVSDVGKSSLDSIWLGEPHVVFFAGGIVQIQTIYEASNSRGIARIYGVTVFLNGRAGMGDNLGDALRQALRLPPSVTLERFGDPEPVDRAFPIRLQVSNGLTQRIRVSSQEGRPRSPGTCACATGRPRSAGSRENPGSMTCACWCGDSMEASRRTGPP